MKQFVIVFLVIFLCGCSSQTVIVTDGDGKAIQNAEIQGVSLSMNVGNNTTDKNGKASVPSNIQENKWVRISKAGYVTKQLSIPKKWPLKVVLEKK